MNTFDEYIHEPGESYALVLDNEFLLHTYRYEMAREIMDGLLKRGRNVALVFLIMNQVVRFGKIVDFPITNNWVHVP